MDVDVYVSYTGNHNFITKTYVDNKFKKAFITYSTKTGFLNWDYHTIPFFPNNDRKTGINI